MFPLLTLLQAPRLPTGPLPFSNDTTRHEFALNENSQIGRDAFFVSDANTSQHPTRPASPSGTDAHGVAGMAGLLAAMRMANKKNDRGSFSDRLQRVRNLQAQSDPQTPKERGATLQIISEMVFFSPFQIGLCLGAIWPETTEITNAGLKCLKTLLHSPQLNWALEESPTELFHIGTWEAILDELIRTSTEIINCLKRKDEIEAMHYANFGYNVMEVLKDFFIHASYIQFLKVNPGYTPTAKTQHILFEFSGTLAKRHISAPIVQNTRELLLAWAPTREYIESVLNLTGPLWALSAEIRDRIPWEPNPANTECSPWSRFAKPNKPLFLEFKERPIVDFSVGPRLKPRWCYPNTLWARLFGRENLLARGLKRWLELYRRLPTLNEKNQYLYSHSLLAVEHLCCINPEFVRRFGNAEFTKNSHQITKILLFRAFGFKRILKNDGSDFLPYSQSDIFSVSQEEYDAAFLELENFIVNLPEEILA